MRRVLALTNKRCLGINFYCHYNIMSIDMHLLCTQASKCAESLKRKQVRLDVRRLQNFIEQNVCKIRICSY